MLIEEAVKEEIDVLDLYETYPDFFINAPKEQDRLQHYQNIILQFPLHWYSCPALLQEYLDNILERGWAFGDGGKALHGKNLSCTVTTGGTKHSFSKRGHNKHSITDFLLPFEQTAHTCQMKFHPPFVVYKAHHIEEAEAKEYRESYTKYLRKLNT
jgi:glutathione-regulated potassium-efflux system ancillary protein KefG